MGASTFVVVTTASTETLNGTILGFTFLPPLPVPKVTPKIVLVRYSKKKLAMTSHHTHKVEAPRCQSKLNGDERERQQSSRCFAYCYFRYWFKLIWLLFICVSIYIYIYIYIHICFIDLLICLHVYCYIYIYIYIYTHIESYRAVKTRRPESRGRGRRGPALCVCVDTHDSSSDESMPKITTKPLIKPFKSFW